VCVCVCVCVCVLITGNELFWATTHFIYIDKRNPCGGINQYTFEVLKLVTI